MKNKQVTKSWKLYGVNGQNQLESFNKSFKSDLSTKTSEKEFIRIYEVFNSDTTHTNKYSIVKITTNSNLECCKELDAQISDGFFSNARVGEVEEIINSWDDVLEREAEWLIKELNEHKDTANIECFFPNYKDIIEQIQNATDDYTEFVEVAEEFTYTKEEWLQKIEDRFKPIVLQWFESFCKQNNDNELYRDYIEQFWGKRDYNKLFADLQKHCEEENCLNAFHYILLNELIELNFLLDRLIIFCENVDQEELEDCECGDKVLKLYQLADTLFTRTSKNED